MKNFLKITTTFVLLVAFLFSCTKQENQVIATGGTNPVFAAVGSLALPTVLQKPNASNVWNTFNWTNPNYQFNTGVSSQNVTYTVQFDTTGSNFTSPFLGEISIANQLSSGLLVGDVNKALNVTLGLKENIPHNIEMRIKSTMVNSSLPLYSNVLKTVITPYLDTKVTLPANLPVANGNSGDLFLVGDATNGGWNNPVPTPTQKFTQTNAWTYEITVPLTGGKQYLFLPKNGDWGHKYACASNSLAGLSAGGDFDADLSDNFPGPSATGNYKIVVDFKLGKFTVTKL